MSLKNNIYSACLKLLDDKIADHQSALHELTAGSGNDSKSSVGDKHETARAMMQLEYEKITVQLHEVQAQKETLEKIKLPDNIFYFKNPKHFSSLLQEK